MEIIPAIDLKNGEAVRLHKGCMNSAKVYSNRPVSLASEFQSLGARWLHVIDLDGALCGSPQNASVISNIVRSTKLKVEVGGGIRNEDMIKFYIDLGVSRVILGSVSLRDPEFTKEMANKYPVVVAIDAKNGKVALDGWSNFSEISANELACEYANAGAEAIICTDISRDGTLNGVNLEFAKSIYDSSKLPTIASGGVRDLKDIEQCKQSSYISGVIVGKAYYEGTIDLREALLLD